MFITNGGVADTYVTFAITDATKGRNGGISAFIVEKDTPGFKVGKKERKLGLHGSNTTELIFDQAEVPCENLIGQEGDGWKIAMGNLDVGRIGMKLVINFTCRKCRKHINLLRREDTKEKSSFT